MAPPTEPAPLTGTDPMTTIVTRKRLLPVALLLLTGTAAAEPPFFGTIFIDPDIITPATPTRFVSAPYAGQGMRVMFDRRANAFIGLNAYLFVATYSDGLQIEFQVNPEFGSVAAAEEQVAFYAPVIGRLPRALRVDVETSWIHRGDQPFGGGNNNLLIHTGALAESYIAEGILEETLAHEAAHTSLDAMLAQSAAWLSAQQSDGEFISTYARDNPTTEDVAESFVPYLAVTCAGNRIDAEVAATIRTTIPGRIAVFDAAELDLAPVDCSGETVFADGFEN